MAFSKSNLSTPSSKLNTPHHHSKTPQAKHRLNFTLQANASIEHPVEVIARIRDIPEPKSKPNNADPSALQINPDRKSLRVKTDVGYHDFSLDGVSLSEEDDLEGFYKKFLETRIDGVKIGQKCTVMMYGPTGSGKSHTMFGSSKQSGIVYNALKAILGDEVGIGNDGERIGLGTFVHVTILEIYNEEIYDLLSSGSNGGGWGKGRSASKVRLEVIGKKAKNAAFMSGNEADKILREIKRVEKRRIVKSTLCNERSSRSHCMITIDVPTVGGRLMLVDMAGSENIEQAGQSGFEAKMQTGKINQGNIALKRVVESIANSDSHVPFRDSKLTMLLQDSFEDDKSKILMILCASPDPKELHKTIATLEYGAKAKCIVRGPHTPTKDKVAEDSSSAIVLGSRIQALNLFIAKLQIENKVKEKERSQARKELEKKEEELSVLKAKLAMAEDKGGTKESEVKVNERIQMLKTVVERKIRECQKMADEFVEKERRKMEDRMLQQQQEVEILRKRLEDIESEILFSKAGNSSSSRVEGGGFMKRLMEASRYEDSDMVKSMDLDMSIDLEPSAVGITGSDGTSALSSCSDYTNNNSKGTYHPIKACLTTVYEEEEEGYNNSEEHDDLVDEIVEKEVIKEKRIITSPEVSLQNPEKSDCFLKDYGLHDETKNPEYKASRQMRIQNIFTLCGNDRELSHHINESSKFQEINSDDNLVAKKTEFGKSNSSVETLKEMKENQSPSDESSDGIEVLLKWETSKENPGTYITKLNVLRDSNLADLRKLIEIHLGADQQAFTFLVLNKDDSGAPSVPKEEESTTQVTKLPICNNLLNVRLASLRALKKPIKVPHHIPFSPLENKMTMPKTPVSQLSSDEGDDCLSPKIAQHLSSTPFITTRRIIRRY